jgi:hypothetical protein
MLEWEDSWIRLREHGVGGFRIWENGMKEKWSATLVLILLFPFLFIKKEKEKKKRAGCQLHETWKRVTWLHYRECVDRSVLESLMIAFLFSSKMSRAYKLVHLLNVLIIIFHQLVAKHYITPLYVIFNVTSH